MFPEQQIRILEWFLKDCGTLQMSKDAKNLVLITGINYIKKYIQIESSFFYWYLYVMKIKSWIVY